MFAKVSRDFFRITKRLKFRLICFHIEICIYMCNYLKHYALCQKNLTFQSIISSRNTEMKKKTFFFKCTA